MVPTSRKQLLDAREQRGPPRELCGASGSDTLSTGMHAGLYLRALLVAATCACARAEGGAALDAEGTKDNTTMMMDDGWVDQAFWETFWENYSKDNETMHAANLMHVLWTMGQFMQATNYTPELYVRAKNEERRLDTPEIADSYCADTGITRTQAPSDDRGFDYARRGAAGSLDFVPYEFVRRTSRASPGTENGASTRTSRTSTPTTVAL